ncbi:hypothetical protein [Microbacterium sp.]|uniref:hypothetical protein n=1 Tax=Microbacterium sp. TaxID=51671 RepID=UPI003A8AEA14
MTGPRPLWVNPTPATAEGAGGHTRAQRGRERRIARRITWVVTGVFFAAALIVFRDVLVAIPAILRGEEVISGDELVPFFNVHSQLLDQAAGWFNDLTNGYEFRVRYAFLTTWLRYFTVLPFALLLVIPAVFTLVYRAVTWFITDVFRTLSPVTVAVTTAFPVALLYLIVTYAKITHFYTLLLGLAMMTVAVLFTVHAVLFARGRWVRRLVAACLLILFNPAVHYLILFAVFFVVAATTLLAGEIVRWIRTGGPARMPGWLHRIRSALVAPARRARLRRAAHRWGQTVVGRGVVAGLLLLFVVLIPYQLFVTFVALRGVENLAETVPGDYYFIRDASVSWLHMLSWDLAGIMDKILFGDYLAKMPRFTNILYSLLFFAPLLLPPIRRALLTTRAHRQLFGVVLVVALFAMWATIGYAEPTWFPTFHRTLAALTRAVYDTHSALGDLALTVSSTVVQVLRFPHRFQLLLFVLAPLVMSLALAWAVDALGRRLRASVRHELRPRDRAVVQTAAAAMLVTLFFVPFWSNPNYRLVFGSGNFGTFAAPYPTADLADLKTHLTALPQGKTVVLPPTETAKLTTDDNGIDHKFIDKFFIYYLDQPSFYYGLTGDGYNKYAFFLILRGIYYQQDWWINQVRDIGIRYIVVNKRLRDNKGVGVEYLPDVESYTVPAMQRQVTLGHLRQAYENDTFVLYEMVDRAPADRPPLIIDTTWNGYLDLVWNRLDLTRCYDFQHLPFLSEADAARADAVVYTNDPVRATVDLWAEQHRDAFFAPSPKILPFNPDLVSSNYYLSPMFREFLLFSNTKWNRTEMITPGVFATLDGSFVAAPHATEVTVPISLPRDGRYHLLLRGAATVNTVTVDDSGLDLHADVELRGSADAMQYYSADTVYTPHRTALDLGGSSAASVGASLDAGVVPVSGGDEYYDLGVVSGTAGRTQLTITKKDDNQLLMEGVLVIPESDYRADATDSRIVTSPSELSCTDTSDVQGTDSPGYVDPAANGPHRDLSDEELLTLAAAGVSGLEPGAIGASGSTWTVWGLGAIALLVAGLAVRAHLRPRRDDLAPATQEWK